MFENDIRNPQLFHTLITNYPPITANLLNLCCKLVITQYSVLYTIYMTQSANLWKALQVWTLGSRRDTIKWRYQVAWSVPRALRCSWTSARKLEIKWWSLSTNVRPLLKVETQQQHSEIGSVHSGVLCRSGQREQQCKSNERPTCEREWHAEGSQISIGRVTW